MVARMRSLLGWMRRRVDGLVASPLGARRRTARVPSVFDSLERREVLSTMTVAPFVALPGVVTTPTATTHSPSTAESGQIASADYVQALYRTVLDRAAGPNETAAWVADLDSGMTPKVVAQSVVNSVEHRQDEVDGFYQQFLHRAPDAGSAAWVDDLLAGMTDQAVEAGILDSPEYQSAHPGTGPFVGDLFEDVLGRQGETPELSGWQSALTGGGSRQQVTADFVTSPEANDHAVDGLYASYLNRPREVPGSNLWVDMLDEGDSISDVAVGILTSSEFVYNSQQP